MSERESEVYTELAASTKTRVEIGQDGVLHVLAGYVTLHLDRDMCEELTTTLARAVVKLARLEPTRREPRLRLVAAGAPAKSIDDTTLAPVTPVGGMERIDD
jgi:hypothetical protein